MTNGLQWHALIGVLRYEFWMQLRRPALWITTGLVGLFVLRTFHGFYLVSNGLTVDMRLGSWSAFLANFYPIAAGLPLADRYTRDRKLHTDELLVTTPAMTGARFWGKWVGTVVATLLPCASIYLVGAVVIM